MTASPLQTNVTSLHASRPQPGRRLGVMTGYMLLVLVSGAFWALLLTAIF